MAWPWIIGGAIVGLITIIANSDSSSESSSSSSGPSKAELKGKKEAEICERAIKDMQDFLKSYDQYFAMDEGNAIATRAIFQKTNFLRNDIANLEKASTSFLEAYEKKGNDAIKADLACLESLAASLNEFNPESFSVSSCPLYITPSHRTRELLEQMLFLQTLYNDTQNYQGVNIPKELKKYATSTPTLTPLLHTWAGLLLNAKSPLPRIVVCGLLKAGKSSLLNMLTNHIDDECFKVDVVRATVQEQTFEYNGMIFIDTPGLDADKKDEENAWDTYTKADIFIYVNATGEAIKEQEINFIKRLYNERCATAKEIIVVITNCEKFLQDKNTLNRLLMDFNNKLEELLQVRPWLQAISNTRYKKGKKDGKNMLIESSGIPALQEHLQAVCDKFASDNGGTRKNDMLGISEIFARHIEKDLEKAQKNSENALEKDNRVLIGMIDEYHQLCLNWQKEVKQYTAM